MNTENITSLLILNSVMGLHANRLEELLTYFEHPNQIITASAAILKKCGLTEQMINTIHHAKDIEHELSWLEQTDHHFIHYKHPQYPEHLRQIDDPPIGLYIIGEPSILSSLQLAMVGSRNPSHTGRDNAYAFASELARLNITVTSGLAIGIDTACHNGALDHQGKTIAVLGSGLESIYPRKNVALAQAVTQNGCLISEYPLKSKPSKISFPIRNRIISGLSLGTIVVEASLRSGSLITARLAAEQGREVFAIPGSIHNPLSQGCHKLLQSGAKLVTQSNDILNEIRELHNIHEQPQRSKTHQHLPKLDTTSQNLLNCIGFELAHVDQIIVRSGLDAATVTGLLLKLQINGYICANHGGYLRVK